MGPEVLFVLCGLNFSQMALKWCGYISQAAVGLQMVSVINRWPNAELLLQSLLTSRAQNCPNTWTSDLRIFAE